MPRYRQLLESLRQSFPQPVSDQVHDAYFVFTILRALDQVDALKGQAPILGEAVEPDWAAAAAARIAEQGLPLEKVIPELVGYLDGMLIWGHPRSQLNVVPPPSIASIIGVLLPSTYNPNLVSDESSHRVAEAEVRVSAMAAALVGYDPQAASGVFTFGGTGTLLYGVRIGLEKALPGAFRQGLRTPAVILASEQAHYSVRSVAAWLGIGEDNVVSIPTERDNSIRTDVLEEQARQCVRDGRRIATIVATVGSTDAFGLDDLEAIRAVRDRLVADEQLDYTPHIHADAVIGWAWSVFNDYDFEANPLGFRGRTVRALAAAQYRVRHLRLADSLGIDFHKTAYCPYISSLFLAADRRDFQRVARSRATMPYLFQAGTYHPGVHTLETSRCGAGPMAALANLLLFGREGLRVLLGHAVEMAEVLRERIESHPDLTVLNGDNVGPVTLLRVYPHGVDTFTVKDREQRDAGFRERLLWHNDYNRRIYYRVHAEAMSGRGVALSLTECYRETDYGEPIAALKSYVLSPFADEERMRSIINHVLAAREQVEANAC
jgi:glutamate/tyrosine decarboxylase-like PLP-dependent enzyme